MERRAYASVTVGEVVYSHGVPFEVTEGPVTYQSDQVVGGEVVYFVGIYRGQDLGADSPMAPFVTRPGDAWTFQRATPYAWLHLDNEGSWHQGA